MNIGIDIGWTLKGYKPDNNPNIIAPHCIDIIKNWIKQGHNIYIISKVNQEQKNTVGIWLNESDFFYQTGINPNNLYFCWERKDKALFVRALNITTMIDDRPEVMAYLDRNVFKLLINPDVRDLERFKFDLYNTFVVTSWKEIDTIVNDTYFAEYT